MRHIKSIHQDILGKEEELRKMVFLIESLISCLLFTIIAGGMTYFNPLSMIQDYPPAIQKKVKELGLITDEKSSFTIKYIIRKIIAIILFGLVLAFLVHKCNGVDTFGQGFVYSYLLFCIVDWWDAMVMDCLWFCHSGKVVIPGTEGMKEYKDYWFHIKGGLKGMLLGLPICALAGVFVELFSWV